MLIISAHECSGKEPVSGFQPRNIVVQWKFTTESNYQRSCGVIRLYDHQERKLADIFCCNRGYSVSIAAGELKSKGVLLIGRIGPLKAE